MKVQIVITVVALAAYELTQGHLWASGEGTEGGPSCPPNEIFKNCPGNCTSCEERGICANKCDRSGCDCWPRFFRLTPGGPCEPVAKCPKMACPENEVFRECGPLCERCGLFNCRVILCNHKCYCKQGYRRDFTGQCVPEDECPQRRRCLRDEVMADSGPVDEFCLRAPGEPPNTETQDVRRCYCKPGYKRNFMGRCIEESRCQEVSCLGVEEYSNCVPSCNTTCRNYGDPTCKEDGNCFPGCFCRPGYALNDYHACVPVEDCVEGGKRIFPADVIRKESEKESPTTDSPQEERVEEATPEPEAEETGETQQAGQDTGGQPEEGQESPGDTGGQPEESQEAAEEQEEVASSGTEESKEEGAETPDEETKQDESADEAENGEPEEEAVENPQEADTTPSPPEEQPPTEATKTKASRRRKSSRNGDEEKLRSGRKKQISDNEK